VKQPARGFDPFDHKNKEVFPASAPGLRAAVTAAHRDPLRRRGTGHSQRDVADLSLEAMISDLEAVVDRAGVAEVSLLGQYNSCPHAITYAARPGRAA
jgi:hypothetical protein